jgi:hypothetical protein
MFYYLKVQFNWFVFNYLVADFKDAWRWFSMQAMALGGVLTAAWMCIPESLKQQAPEWLTTGAVIAIFACGIIGRLIAQPGAGKPSEESVVVAQVQEEQKEDSNLSNCEIHTNHINS